MTKPTIPSHHHHPLPNWQPKKRDITRINTNAAGNNNLTSSLPGDDSHTVTGFSFTCFSSDPVLFGFVPSYHLLRLCSSLPFPSRVPRPGGGAGGACPPYSSLPCSSPSCARVSCGTAHVPGEAGLHVFIIPQIVNTGTNANDILKTV